MRTQRPGSPASLNAFIAIVIAVGFLVTGHSLLVLVQAHSSLGWLALGCLAVLASSFALKVPGVPAYLSISDAFFIASALLFGPAAATVTIAVDSLIVSLRRRNDVRQLLFNSASSALALWCGAHVYYLLAQQPTPLALSPATPMVAPLYCLAAVYFLLNSGLTAEAVALSKGLSAPKFWRQHFLVMSLNYLAAASAAYLFVLLVQQVGAAAVAVVVPLILVCHLAMRSWLGRVDDAQRHLARVNELYLSTVSALSTAIEAKDGVTSDHVHRVKAYALGLADALDIREPLTVQAIEAAALLHDTGKLAIPEHILNKPGKLTESEFEIMKSHVNVGADILSAIDFPYPVVPIVRAHHENWDGSGYPNGLRGEDIPIGARILSVVDCFDALTSDRPYRPAMTDDAALEILIARRGTMYDPSVVDTFRRVYQTIEVSAPTPQLEKAVRNIRLGAAASVVAGSPAVAAQPTVSDELLGFVSLARLTSGSPGIRDVGAFAWTQLRQLAPNATMALYALDESKTSIASQYVAGPAAASVPGVPIPLGERISGWVAANCRAMTDADAVLDLGKGCEGTLRYALASPLVGDRGLLGVLTLYSAEPFGEQLALTVEMIGPHLAKAVAAATTAETSHRSTQIDGDRHVVKHRGLSLVSRR